MKDTAMKETGESGPIYGVKLIDSLPIGNGSMMQAMPDRDDLERCRKRGFERVAAGYEVLLAHYKALAEACNLKPKA